MEAYGKYDFSATAEDELSFRMGDVLKILGTNDNWYKAEFHGHEGYVPINYVDRPIPSWFQEHASRTLAEEMLKARQLGAFLIRGSQSSPGEFSISVKHEFDVQHFKVMKDNKGHYFLWPDMKFSSINRLVDHYKTSSISRQMQLFLQDGSRNDMAPPMHIPKPMPMPMPMSMSMAPPMTAPLAPPMAPPTQGMRSSLPEERSHTHGGYGGSPNFSGHRRASDMVPPMQYKRNSLEERAHTIGTPGMASSLASFPPPRRPSDSMPFPQRPAMQVRAMYDFTAEEQDELAFSAGEIIEVLDHSDSSWWKGRLRGRIGLFPANYTKPI